MFLSKKLIEIDRNQYLAKSFLWRLHPCKYSKDNTIQKNPTNVTLTKLDPMFCTKISIQDNNLTKDKTGKVAYFDIFAVNSLTSLAATIAVIPSTVSR